mgnify:CR=1 FL=1
MNSRAPSASEARTSAERRLVVGRDRPIRISAGHRLQHHDGKCSRPHGHNYEIRVEVTGTVRPEEGWVVDKGDITAVLSEWDHMFLLERGDPLVEAFESSGDADAVVVLDQPPTAEVMAMVLEDRMAESFPDTVTDVSVEVSETSELCATV